MPWNNKNTVFTLRWFHCSIYGRRCVCVIGPFSSLLHLLNLVELMNKGMLKNAALWFQIRSGKDILEEFSLAEDRVDMNNYSDSFLKNEYAGDKK